MYILFFTPCLLLNPLQSVPTSLQELLLLGSITYRTNPTSIFVITSLWHLTPLLILETFSSYNLGVTFCFSAYICGLVSLMELFFSIYALNVDIPKGCWKCSSPYSTFSFIDLIYIQAFKSHYHSLTSLCQESRLLSRSTQLMTIFTLIAPMQAQDILNLCSGFS